MVTREWVEEIRRTLPELPAARRARFVSQFELSTYDATLLTSSKTVADFFEQAVTADGGAPPKAVANWILGDLSRIRGTESWDTAGAPLSPAHLAQLIRLIDSGTISGKMGKDLLGQAVASGKAPQDLVAEQGLSQVTGEDQLGAWVDQVIAENAKSAQDFKGGKPQALGFLVGQVMKLSKGRANPERVNGLLREKLK